MKWPTRITIVRHGQSKYNALRREKEQHPLWQEFKKAFEENPEHPYTVGLAHRVREMFALGMSDYDTPLTLEGARQAKVTGLALSKEIPKPDVVIVSPYYRTRHTFREMCLAWPALGEVPHYHDERVREQEHGLSLLYNDWRVFHTLHPEQRALYNLMGAYWYQFPQGENVAMVRARARSMVDTVIREFAGDHVMIVTHHLWLLAVRANLERWSPERFVEVDDHEKPVNCGVTTYHGIDHQGENGKLVLSTYNAKYYADEV